ncbi:MAG: DUF3794 domain-containing protein [Oscillospiraceae bacterium]|nr:DUF3794 domain-containing protein [Oscillospiraceae bacterium]
MDFRLEKETVINSKEVFSKNCEQSVELDCILPDYYPDIFRLVKCIMTPAITSRSVSADKVMFELSVEITVWYCTEGNSALNTVTQKLQYSKSVDTGVSCENAIVKITPKCDYVNPRAVNSRRLDIRGAVSCCVSVTMPQEQSVISAASGCGIQLLKKTFVAAAGSSFVTKSFVCEDEFDLGSSKPPVTSIVRSGAFVTNVDKKLVSGRLVAKGEIGVNLLYAADDGSGMLENMQFSMPFSQILDTNDIVNADDWILDAQCTFCDISASSNDDGEAKRIKCSAMIYITALSQQSREVEIITDAYSTEYMCALSECDICLDSNPIEINLIHSAKETFSFESDEIESICSVWAQSEAISSRIEANQLIISGKIKWSILAKTGESYTVYEKENVFEHTVPDFGDFEVIRCDISANVCSCSYTLSDAKSVSLKADVRISGCAVPSVCVKALCDITMDESNKIKCDDGCALRLYFAQNGEKIWDIAKRYKTSAKAVCEENAKSCEDDECCGMMMIPMVSN